MRDEQRHGRKPQTGSLRENLGGRVRRDELEAHSRVGNTVLVAQGLVEFRNNRADSVGILRLHDEHNVGIRGNGVVLSTTERGRDSHIRLVGNGVDSARKNLKCVCAFELDVELAVPALKAANQKAAGGGVRGRRCFELSGNVHREGDVATASGQDLFVGNPVEVDHAATLQLGRVELIGTRLALLFHGREHGLERRVRGLGVVEESQDVRHTDAVVGSE